MTTEPWSPGFTLDPAADNYAVIGHPVGHSQSPRIHRAFARQTGQVMHYQAIQVPVDGFERALERFAALGGKGLNVTLPFKARACAAAAVLTDRARDAGAVNTLTFTGGSLHGDNTDGAGLLRDLDRHRIRIGGRRLLVLGAGGAVAGVLGPLLDRGPARLLIANRTLARAEALVAGRARPGLEACSLDALGAQGRFDVIINAISSGLHGDLPPLPASLADGGTACYDLLYGRPEPPFCRWGRERGAAIVLDGLGMLVEQAAESFFIWRGVRPETEEVIAMLRKEL